MADPLLTQMLAALRYENADPATRDEVEARAGVQAVHRLIGGRAPAQAAVLPMRAGRRG